MIPLSGGPWDDVQGAAWPLLFFGLPLWAVRGCLAWGFGFSFQEPALDVSRLRGQFFSLMDCVRHSGSCFAALGFEPAELDI